VASLNLGDQGDIAENSKAELCEEAKTLGS